jgi:hypothetical protein
MRTRILIEGKELDLTDEVTVPLTYNIVDIRNPEKRTGNYSRQIIVPGTKANDSIFSKIWDLSVTIDSSGTTNYSPGFDPNLKAEAIVIDDGSVVFEGFVRLNKITQSHFGYKHDYDITLQSQMADLYTNMGEKTLADLNLDTYNHTYNKTEQVNSWATSVKVNGVSTPFALGQGYVYPMIDYGYSVNDVDYNVTHFFPSVYFKTIYDAIISENGFQVTSSFLNSTEWKSLILDYSGGQLKLSQTQVNQRTHKASSTGFWNDYSSGGTSSYPPIIFDDDSTGTNHDAGNIYSTATNKMTVAANGNYTINFGISVRLTHYPSSSPATTQQHFKLGWYEIKKIDTNNQTSTIGSILASASHANYVTANMLNITVPTSVNSGDQSSVLTGILTTTAQLQAGDQVYVSFSRYVPIGTTSMYSGQTYASGAMTLIQLQSGSYFESRLNDTALQEGDTVPMSNVLPSTIKQKDFISSVNKAFNLYYEPDKNILNNFFVEPRNDFYSSGTTQDWSFKLENEKDLEIVPMGELEARRYYWTWKADSDHFNKLYSDRNNNRIYGEREYSIVNDFIKNENKTEVIFSPTPLAARPGSTRVIPRIYQESNGVITPKTGNPRMLYYGGVKTTLDTWNYVTSSGSTTMSTYAYAGHLDDIDNPTIDINFGVPKEVFYNASNYTDNNLFNKYWYQFINEITDKNSKIVTGLFNLSAADIEKLSFRDTYHFARQNFRLNKIIDYVPGSKALTKCEFILLKQGVPFSATSATVNGGRTPTGFTSSDELPPSSAQRVGSGSNTSGRNVLVSGENNIVDPTAKGIIVSGSSNFVGANCTNVSLVASSGCCVMADVQNVTLVNCSGLTIDASYAGKTVFENVIYGHENLLYKEAAYTCTYSDGGKYLLMNPAANIVVNLPSNTTISNGWSILIKHGNNGAFKVTTTITDAGVTFEDGASTTDIINALEHFTYTYRSNVWYITN